MGCFARALFAFGTDTTDRQLIVYLWLIILTLKCCFRIQEVAQQLNIDQWMEASQPDIIQNDEVAREVMAICEETQKVSTDIKNTRKG